MTTVDSGMRQFHLQTVDSVAVDTEHNTVVEIDQNYAHCIDLVVADIAEAEEQTVVAIEVEVEDLPMQLAVVVVEDASSFANSEQDQEAGIADTRDSAN